jgi:hypothetical protein
MPDSGSGLSIVDFDLTDQRKKQGRRVVGDLVSAPVVRCVGDLNAHPGCRRHIDDVDTCPISRDHLAWIALALTSAYCVRIPLAS